MFSQVMEYLRSHRCLLVVDDVQTIYGWRHAARSAAGNWQVTTKMDMKIIASSGNK